MTRSIEDHLICPGRKQCQLPADAAVDFRDGETVLSATDTPRSRGWPQRNEVRQLRSASLTLFNFRDPDCSSKKICGYASNNNWWVLWNMTGLFSHSVGNVILPIDEL